MYFKAHACLDAYMNILRRNPNTTRITVLIITWRMTSRQLEGSARRLLMNERFELQTQIKS